MSIEHNLCKCYDKKRQFIKQIPLHAIPDMRFCIVNIKYYVLEFMLDSHIANNVGMKRAYNAGK